MWFWAVQAASKKRTFEVFVAEGAPSCPGYDMANELAEKGIKVTGTMPGERVGERRAESGESGERRREG